MFLNMNVFIVFSLVLYCSSKVSLADTSSANLHSIKLNSERNEIHIRKNSKHNVHHSRKVQINVYYETLCPDSRYYLMQEVEPVITDLADYVKVVLVPYGKARTIAVGADDYEFRCQHGSEECAGNLVHACMAHELAETDNLLAVRMASCMIDNNEDYFGALERCAPQLEVDAAPIRECACGKLGRGLLAAAGKLTNAAENPLEFVPMVTVDGSKQNLELELRPKICKRIGQPLPPGCA